MQLADLGHLSSCRRPDQHWPALPRSGRHRQDQRLALLVKWRSRMALLRQQTCRTFCRGHFRLRLEAMRSASWSQRLTTRPWLLPVQRRLAQLRQLTQAFMVSCGLAVLPLQSRLLRPRLCVAQILPPRVSLPPQQVFSRRSRPHHRLQRRKRLHRQATAAGPLVHSSTALQRRLARPSLANAATRGVPARAAQDLEMAALARPLA